MPTTLSIIIVNWNSKDYLRGSLASIRATCAHLQPEIVVVDGASYDGCDQMLEREFPGVRFIQSPENVGFARCNNLGLQVARGDFILLLNPDTELRPHAIERLIDVLRDSPRTGMVGPRILNTDGTLQTSCVQALPTPLNQALDADSLRRVFPRSRLWGTYTAFTSSQPTEVEAISGACMLVRKSTIDQVCGFTPIYFMYAEDMDLCRKIREIGQAIVHVPAAEIVHHGGGSSRAQPSHFSIVAGRSALHVYMKRHDGSVGAASFRLLQGASAAARVGLLTGRLLLSRGPNRVRTRAALAKWSTVFNWAFFGSKPR